MRTSSVRRPPGWSVLTILLVAAAGAWSALPGGLPRAVGIVLVDVVVVGALVLAVRDARPETRRHWRLLLVGQVVNVLAWASWVVLPVLAGPLGAINAGDVLFLAAYLLSLAAVAGLARTAGAGTGALLDGAVLGVSGGVLIWATIGSSQAAAEGVGVAARAVGVAYPMLDVLLVAAALPLAVARRGPRSLLLVGWAALQLAGDLVYGWQVAAGGSSADSLIYALFVAGYALLAGAALHPCAQRAVRPGPWSRRVVLLVGVLPLPGLLVVRVAQGSARQVLLVAVASLVVTLLAVVRAAQSGAPLPDAAERALRRSLHRGAALLAVGALLPLAGLTALSVTQARATMETELLDRLQATTTRSVLHTEDKIGTLQDLVGSYADRRLLARALASSGPAALATLTRHVDELAGRSDAYAGAWVVDARGTLVAVSNGQSSVLGMDVSQRDYLRVVQTARTPYASNAFVSALPGAPRLVGLAAPVLHDGRLVGAVVLGLRLEALNRGIGVTARPLRAEVTLLDRQGVVLAGPELAERGLTPSRHRKEHALAQDGREGVLRGTGRDGAWTAYAPLPSAGYTVVARVSASAASRPARLFTGRVAAGATLVGQLLLAGLLLQVAAERRRRAAEVLVAAREEQVRDVLQAAGDAFFSFDGQGRVVAWNRRAEEVYGWTAQEVLGVPLTDLVVVPEDRAAFTEALQTEWVGLERGGAVLELEQRRRDGVRFPVEVTVWSTTSGGQVAHNAFARDITDRREHEAALARARDEAVRTSRLKSEFVANMSHEIRTPLNGVVGMTTLLQGTGLDAHQRAFVDTLAGSADALVRVLDDVLDFSKIEAGQLDVEQVDVALGPLAREVGALFSAAAGVKGLDLDVVVDPEVPPVLRTDGHRLRQVLTNLVSNAVKFTASGAVVVEVDVDGPEQDDGVPVRLTVRDTGPGIRTGDQQRLFEPFAQADSSITRTHGGTGLGLTISRRLVVLLGGDLSVRSTPGAGSSFEVRLVLPRGQEAAPPPAPVPDVPAAVVGPRGRLLVAEDSLVNQLVVVEMLRMAGYEADVAGDGEQAVAMLEQGDYDLVLMDCQMPVLDGFGATARIRGLPSPRSATPVVALTASALVEDRDQCLAAGMDDFLAKPLRLDELQDVLGRVLGARR